MEAAAQVELEADAWDKLTGSEGEACYYQRHPVCRMEWNDRSDAIALENFRVYGSHFGGPVALMRDKSKPLKIGQSAVALNKIFIYTSGGRLLSEITWEGEEIAQLGWNDDELLICMQVDGVGVAYDLHGDYQFQFSTGRAVREQGVSHCCIWGSGAVLLTMENNIFWVSAEAGFEDARTIELPAPLLDSTPTCMTVIEPRLTGRDSPDVLLAADDGTVVVVDSDDTQEYPTAQGPFNKMECSSNGQLIACFTMEGQVVVFSADFEEVALEFDTNAATAPDQLVWCGGDCVVMAYSNIVFMVGPSGSWINFRPDSAFVVVPEMDGVRIITNTKCEFLQRVPQDLVDVFQAGSTDPSAMLFDAYQELYDRKSAKADDKMRAIEDDLGSAVNTCIGAATDPWESAAQKKLLDAACYGKAFVEHYDSDYFVSTCKNLRVLNVIRSSAIGIHMTYRQYEQLTPDVVVNRLIRRQHWDQAYAICKYLDLKKPERVPVQWSCDKIKLEEDTPDLELCEKIYEKLKDCPGGSFVDVAQAADRENRRKLAVMLLDHEASAMDQVSPARALSLWGVIFNPCSAAQVPLLLQMGEPEQALVKAIDSGDTNLAHMVLIQLQDRGSLDQDDDRYLSRKDFYAMLQNKPAASALFASHLREQGRLGEGGSDAMEALKSFLYGPRNPRLDPASTPLSHRAWVPQAWALRPKRRRSIWWLRIERRTSPKRSATWSSRWTSCSRTRTRTSQPRGPRIRSSCWPSRGSWSSMLTGR